MELQKPIHPRKNESFGFSVGDQVEVIWPKDGDLNSTFFGRVTGFRHNTGERWFIEVVDQDDNWFNCEREQLRKV